MRRFEDRLAVAVLVNLGEFELLEEHGRRNHRRGRQDGTADDLVVDVRCVPSGNDVSQAAQVHRSESATTDRFFTSVFHVDLEEVDWIAYATAASSHHLGES